MRDRTPTVLLLACILLLLCACGGEKPRKGLMLSLAQFEIENGKATSRPGPARLEILVPREGEWRVVAIEDPESTVFHKAIAYDPGNGAPGILTLGGQKAAVKLWRHGKDGFRAETLWEKDFGGKASRMREAEVADLYGEGTADIAVATHGQGIVAVVRPVAGGGWKTIEMDPLDQPIVHEIEIGDLDGDGVPEVYATPSEINRMDGKAQRGVVVRFVPSLGTAGEVVADLGDRHAKEILVADVDGDGSQELYVSVEAMRKGGRLEIRRYVAGDDPAGGTVIATLQDRMCRFLTSGDLDGDGSGDLVAATFRSGLWLLKPGAGSTGPWDLRSIDRDSSGFEHAAIVTDLDGDGGDELYVASDNQNEVRRYTWNGTGFDKEVILTREVPGSVFTWNINPVPLELVGE